MTIREKGYFHWEGALRQRHFSWWPITRLGVRLAFRKKGFKFLYFGAFVPALAFLVGIYISERIGEFRYMIKGSSQLLEVNPAFFKTYYTSDFLLFMMVMLMVVGGAGLIADDLRYNALQLYFSRPLEKRDYLAGKASVLVAFLLSLTLVPGLAFVLFKLLFSGSFRFVVSYPWILLSVTAYSAAVTAFFCLYTLLLSSLSRNRRYVSILLFAVYLVSDILSGIFYGNFKNPLFALLSLKANLQQMGAFLFKQKPPYDIPAGWSMLVLAAVGAVAWLVVNRRVRSVEVVK
jgi:ABC-type transport system involved in multi-copper enzyme maturation permease subunit